MSETVSSETDAIPVVYSEVNPIRVDKNVAFNIAAFRRFPEDSKLLKAIILYMAINHQDEDLFGFYKLDPIKFAEKMYFNRTFLFRKHPSPFFLEHDPNAQVLVRNEMSHRPNGRMSEHRTWSSYLENALYILTNQSIIDDYRYKEGDKMTVSTTRVNFIDEIRFELIKVGRNHRVMYYYKPNKKYEDNLKSYFLITKIQKFNLLKKPKLDEAYLDILNRIHNANSKGLNAILFNIDTLAHIMQIADYKRFSSKKAKVTEKFEILRKTIGEDVKSLTLTWVNPNDSISSIIDGIKYKNSTGKYKNVAQISWSRLTKKETTDRNTRIFKTIFNQELNRALISAFFNAHEPKTRVLSDERKKKAFYRWMFSMDDMDIKEIKFKDTYLQIYKNTMSLVAFTKEYTRMIKEMAKLQAKHNCFQYENDLIYFHMSKKTVSFRHFHEILTYFEGHYTK